MAAKTMQKLHLTLSFNPFGDNIEIEFFGHANDCVHDNYSVTIIWQVCHKGAVDFERVQRKPRQITQRTISGSKVVH